jgi:molybdopterin/thiamine biosynthesis adenylyltransferase/rhodanese-related sulfurtransferase
LTRRSKPIQKSCSFHLSPVVDMLPELSREEILRYSRHLLIPDVGLTGQRKLKASSALIIGTGGLGSPVSLYLAAAGVGHIGLVDYDVVDETNLQRQVVHGTSTVGKLKVESAKARLLDLNPDIQVDTFNEPFTSANAMKIAEDYDIIIDGTDNFATRYLTNDLCVLTGKPNVYGSIFRFDGQASVFDARSGPCYRCLFPEPPPPGLVPSCAEGGVLGVLPGTIGTIQATEALKILLGIGSTLVGRLLLYNALDMSFEFVKLKKNPKCKVCGSNPEITGLIDYFEFCGVPGLEHDVTSAGKDWDITATELADRIKRGDNLRLIDVREPHELEISQLAGAQNIPLGELAARLPELDSTQEIVFFCKAGSRSTRALELLVSAGFRKVKNLKGGINAWAREVDQNLPVY